MAQIPTPRSYNAVVGGMINRFLSTYGLKSLKVGGPVLSILEAAAISDVRSSQDIFDLLSAISLDRATGVALDRIGADEDILRIAESSASGLVTITDSRYTKKTTKVFQGKPAPIVGSSVVHVVDASSFTATGSLYIGRGTESLEGPLVYTGIVDNGTYYTITLQSGSYTQKFHNIGEAVTLAQGGNRVINAGTVVQTPQGNTSEAIQFSSLYSATIPDGEMYVEGVVVVAKKAGLIGNIPKEIISSFASAPFPGAVVTNPAPFSNGQAAETDLEYRDRIREARASRSRGTKLALKTSVLGITAADENKRVASASVVTRQDYPTTLYIDDGTGYEEKSEGVALEPLNDSGLGGEQYFQLSFGRPVTKAYLESGNSSPFDLSVNNRLALKVSGAAYEHAFNADSFRSLSNASAYEVAASINGDSSLQFSARTSNGGTKVVLFSKTDTNEDIEITVPSGGTDANQTFLFPAGRVDTLRLYKNDRLLSKDGESAILKGNPISTWSTLVSGETLTLSVDGTPPLTFTFVDQDFIDADTGYSSVGINNLDAWVAVINAKIPGITATAALSSLFLTSNAATVARAGVEISGGTLASKGMFDTQSVVGVNRDYTLNRNTGQGRLEVPLAAGDRLTAGSVNTRAFLESTDIAPVALLSTGKLWFDVDGNAEPVAAGVLPALTFTRTTNRIERFGHRFRLTATASSPFGNVALGDWAVLWDSGLPASLQGQWRVSNAGPAFIEIERPEMLAGRIGHQALKLGALPADKVMAIGGDSDGLVLRGCEVYDPATKLWTAVASMNTPRKEFLALRMSDGKILAIGGIDDTGALLNSVEIYDPVGDTWSPTSALPGGVTLSHMQGCLIGSTVFICGGQETAGGYTDKVFWAPYAGSLGAWTASAVMSTVRKFHTVTPLNDGINVLVAGGKDTDTTATASSQVWNSTTKTFGGSIAMPASRAYHGAFKHLDGKVMVIDGFGDTVGDPRTVTAVFDPTGPSWAVGGVTLSEEHAFYGYVVSAALLPTANKIVLHGGDLPTSYAHTAPNAAAGAIAAFSSAYVSGSVNRRGAIGVTLNDNEVIFVGGEYSPTLPISVAAVAERFHDVNGYVDPDPESTTTPFNLAESGISFSRTENQLQQLSVAAAANYTADGFASSLSPQLEGASADTYRTNRLRINTNSFKSDASISLVAANTEALKLELPEGLEVNSSSHLASVESGSPEFGTPEFSAIQVEMAKSSTELILPGAASFTVAPGVVPYVAPDRMIVGARGWRFTSSDDNFAEGVLSSYTDRYGNNRSYWTNLASVGAEGARGSLLTLRETPPHGWQAKDRVYLASPYMIASDDNFVVVADEDVDTRRFAINMWRKLKAGSSTYGTTNVFKDNDNGNATLAQAFGLDYDFNDFVAYMKSRVKSHDGDAARRILWRYKRFGPDGDRARIRYTYPTGPFKALAVSVNALDPAAPDYTSISVALPSDVRKTGYPVRTTTRLGYSSVGVNQVLTVCSGLSVSSATRAATTVTLTLTLPPPISNHGLANGDQIWLQSSSVDFPSGLKTITYLSPTQITYTEAGAAITTPSIGTVSFDVAEATFNGATPTAIAVGDILHLDDWTGIPTAFRGQTIRITGVGAQYIQGFTETPVLAPTSVLTWSTVLDISKIQFYGLLLASCIATAIETAINALDAKCPVTAKVVGTGAGQILLSSQDELATTGYYYQLSDGINWIKTTTSPVLITGDYSLTFKSPIAAGLVTNSDWDNEEIRLVPSTATNIVNWFNTPGVSGLFTDIATERSSNASKIQLAATSPGSGGSIQVQGGTANAVAIPVIDAAMADDSVTPTCMIVSVNAADITGVRGDAWVSLDNVEKLPKSGIVTSATQVTSIVNSGLDESEITVSAVPVYTVGSTTADVIVQVEKQGNFIAYVGGANVGSAIKEGQWVRITGSATAADIDSVNQGIFQVVRVAGNTVWIENSRAKEESGKTATLTYFSYYSLMPGDTLSLNTDAWGAGNRGDWIVKSVGEVASTPFSNTFKFKVYGTMDVQGAIAALGTEAQKIVVLEASPARLIKRISGIIPNQSDAATIDIKLDTGELFDRVTESAGTVLSMLDKLHFSTDLSKGIDGYRYSVGLIGEATKVIYGDERDSTAYPGVAAAGATVNIEGPLVKRVEVSLGIRTKLGINTTDISDKVKSGVAAAINRVGIGVPIAISDIINAASKVNGVQAVTVLSPLYSSGNDLIPVQPYEKPLVLNVDTDVLVSFVGE